MRNPPGLDDVRQREFARLGRSAYLNAASLGPLPERARAAVADYLERRARVHEMHEGDFVRPTERAREAASRLLGGTPGEIALGPNTSFGINLAALGLQVPTGSTVLVSAGEFPANVYPWMNRERYRLETIPLSNAGWPDEDRMLDRIAAGGVSIVGVSSVQFQSGFRADLERIGAVCREHDAFLVVDAIQSLGHIPMNVAAIGADVVAAGGHKWLCGPFGSGFAFVSRSAQERLHPKAIGWYGMQAGRSLESLTEYSWAFVDDASRYEVGTLPHHDYGGLAESTSMLLELGVRRIWERIDDLLQPLRNWLLECPAVTVLSCLEPQRRSGILSFRTPGFQETFEELKRAGVVCSIREGGIRVAAHVYNSDADIARVLEVLESRAAKGWG